MIERKEYLQKLIQWKDEQVIKVVTGMRRCGKSTLLMQYQDYLKSIGVEDDQIITINFEDLEYEELCEYKVLYDYLKERLLSDRPHIFSWMKFRKCRSLKKSSTASI